MLCDNNSINGDGISLKPQCYNNKAKYYVTIHYNESTDKDIVILCHNCLQYLKKDIKKYNYKITLDIL